MKKNGFTLIELLAVVVVLAVILVVASPKIFNAVDESRKQSFLRSSETIVKEANKLYVSDNINISQNGKEFTIENNAFVGESIDVSGELPDSGKIYIDQEGGTAILLRKGDYCVYKDFSEKEITISSNYASCVLNIPEVVPDTCFTRTNNGTEVTITDYNNTCSKNVVIPDTLDGLPVKMIGTSAFDANQLISVKLPNTVTDIASNSFASNKLKYIKIPNSVLNIGSQAFIGNKIEKIDFSQSLKTIGSRCFAHNKLISLSLPSSLTNIDSAAFNNNQLPDAIAYIYKRNSDTTIDTTKVISYGGAKRENVIIPNNISTIGASSFDSVGLISVTIPNSVTNIENNAFLLNNLTSIVIPNSVTTLGIQSFCFNDLTSIVFSINVSTIPGSCFSSNELVNLTIPNHITKIEWAAFSNNKLTNIILPNTITSMGSKVFNNNLLPENQAYIYDRNPDGTENKTRIVSYGGTQKDNMIVPSTVTTIGNSALESLSISKITLPSNLTTIESRGLYWNTPLTIINFPSTLTSVGYKAFDRCDLTNIVAPSNVNFSADSISQTFYDLYNPTKTGGTYTSTSQDGIWTKQP